MSEFDWPAALARRSDDFDSLSVSFVEPSSAPPSWSSPVRVTASDTQSYFVKALSACPAGQEASLVAERVVSLAGQLVGAAVCTVSLIVIPAAVAGPLPGSGRLLTEGIAHASLALKNADEAGRPALSFRAQDDNARRHAGMYALYDWCWGGDNQWLYDLDTDRTVYSHDHGFYFPPTGPTILTAALNSEVHNAHVLGDPPTGLDAQAVEGLAYRLERVTAEQLAPILTSVPRSWPVGDDVLEAIAWFLLERAPGVAARLRALV